VIRPHWIGFGDGLAGPDDDELVDDSNDGFLVPGGVGGAFGAVAAGLAGGGGGEVGRPVTSAAGGVSGSAFGLVDLISSVTFASSRSRLIVS
jgi:hypothetical protein